MLTESENVEIQTIIYCKGWYKKNNIIDDLKVFHAKWAGMRPEHIDLQDLLWFVSHVYDKYVKNKKDTFQFLKDAFHHRSICFSRKSLTMEDFIEEMASEIRLNISTLDVPYWPEPDPSIMELKDSDCLNRWREMHKQKTSA